MKKITFPPPHEKWTPKKNLPKPYISGEIKEHIMAFFNSAEPHYKYVGGGFKSSGGVLSKQWLDWDEAKRELEELLKNS